MITKLSKRIYEKWLPIYIPSVEAKYKIAIWNCMDAKKSNSLWEVFKGIRITIRNGGRILFVIKKGHV